MRALSASSLKTYRRCPQQWKFRYVDKLEEEDTSFFNLGRAVHAALETFHDGRVAAPASVDEMLEAFHEEFDPEVYEDEEEADQKRAAGETMVEDFHARHAPDFEPALAVEKFLTFEVEGVTFRGYVDRIDKVGDDRIRIVDYKTGGSFDLDRVRHEPQLTLYQLGAEQKYGMEVESLALYHVPSQTPFEVDRHPPEQVEKVRSAVREAARGIEDGAFEPDPDYYCQWCDYKPLCPAFADEFPENWEEEEPEPPAPDRYGRLKARKKEISAELEEAEERLEAFFEASGQRAVAGDDWRVKASRREAWRIDDDEALRDLLEPEGLWERVLVTRPNWRKKAALPEDDQLPAEIREACRQIGYEKVLWRLTPQELEEENEAAGGDDG